MRWSFARERFDLQGLCDRQVEFLRDDIRVESGRGGVGEPPTVLLLANRDAAQSTSGALANGGMLAELLGADRWAFFVLVAPLVTGLWLQTPVGAISPPTEALAAIDWAGEGPGDAWDGPGWDDAYGVLVRIDESVVQLWTAVHVGDRGVVLEVDAYPACDEQVEAHIKAYG